MEQDCSYFYVYRKKERNTYTHIEIRADLLLFLCLNGTGLLRQEHERLVHQVKRLQQLNAAQNASLASSQVHLMYRYIFMYVYIHMCVSIYIYV